MSEGARKLIIALCVVIFLGVVSAIAFRIFQSNANATNSTVNATPTIIAPPKPITCTDYAGSFENDENGISIGKNTELAALKNMLKENNCDIIEVSWDNYSKTYPKPIRLAIRYNRKDNTLKLIYVNSGASDNYEGVTDSNLTAFLNAKPKDIHKLTRFTSGQMSFTDAEVKAPTSPKPKQSEWDGTLPIVKTYIGNIVDDPSSLKFINWSEVKPYGDYWVVRCKFSCLNAMGARVINNKLFYIKGNQVEKMTDYLTE
jgi:hypothetical protein